MLKTNQRLGDLLVERNLIQESDLERALHLQQQTGGRIGVCLVRIGSISEDNLLRTIAEQLSMRLVTQDQCPDPSEIYRFMVDSEVNFEWFLSEGVLIWPGGEDTICCIARDVMNPQVDETLRHFHPKLKIEYLLATTGTLDSLFNMLQAEHSVDLLFQDSEDARQLRELAEEAPVVELVNNLLAQAVDVGASDVHFEPLETSFKVRFRVDGVLHDRVSQPLERFAAVASRIKLISGLDIADKRMPQDGRITTRLGGEEMDVRVSTVPSVRGESVVLRLLPKNRAELSLDNIGLAPDHYELMQTWARSNGGIILVTGPTGSGKSTTLHSAILATNDGLRKIMTVEDPVESRLPGITQIQTHSEIGYTFSRALRAILRQDPDVIMIGEIRDFETAEIAIQSALSGHLVLSTLHTNDAISSFTRLIDMGVEPFLVAAPVKGVQAQRLVRMVCSSCMQPMDPPDEIRKETSRLPRDYTGSNWVRAVGCQECQNTGYKGRMGIYQMVPVDEGMQELIVNGASLNVMRDYARQKGCRTLYQDGLLKASTGKTTIEEVLRVVSETESI